MTDDLFSSREDKPRTRYHYGKACWMEVQHSGRLGYRALIGCIECGCAIFRMRGSKRCLQCQRLDVFKQYAQKRDFLAASGFGPKKKVSPPEARNYKQAQALAIRAVANAVRLGTLPHLKVAAIPCVDCNKRVATVYEHRDYAKPLVVEPVCQLCNLRRGPALWIVPTPMDGDAAILERLGVAGRK